MNCLDLKKNILVTGGAGFIGSNLVDALIEENPKKLVVLDNLYLGKETNLEQAKNKFPNLKFIKDSASDFSLIEKIIDQNKIDVVFNLAVIPLPASLIHPKFCIDENINITTNLLELIRLKKFKTLVHFSSSEVYGTLIEASLNEEAALNPLTPYAASKAACDHLVKSYYDTFGIDMLIVRPFNNYGPRQNERNYAGVIPLTIQRIMAGQNPIIHGDGLQTRDFIHVRDTARATIELYKNSRSRGKVINLGSGIEITIKEIMQHLVSIMNFDKDIQYQEGRVADVRRHKANISRARELINFEPQISIKCGLEETVRYYQAKNCS